MTNDDEQMRRNQHAWDLRTAAHLDSNFYDVASFRRGRSSLRAPEREELGDVSGRTLLHLMCHFGMDTLSWARLGARATGVDFSEDAIAAARSLAEEVGVDARFLCANLYDLPDQLQEEFDVVVTTYGALPWLPDLDGWARVVARFLKPGGTFFLAEFHPCLAIVRDVDGRLEIGGSYFRKEPRVTEAAETYADGQAVPVHAEYNWQWTVSGMVTALCRAGLRIERLRELPIDARQRLPSMVRDEDGWRRLPGDPIPLLVTCVATRPS